MLVQRKCPKHSGPTVYSLEGKKSQNVACEPD